MLSAEDCDICFLPYVTECDRKPLNEYFTERTFNPHRIIFSHNDISGIQLGPVMTKTGFSIEEIEANCDLWINGHLHNGQALTPKVINLGNLTGKDFGEDASKHNHNVAVLDTETMSLTYIENPHAYNFYKIQIDTKNDLSQLENLKAQSAVSIKCEQSLIEEAKQKIAICDNIIESRIILVKRYEETADAESSELDLTVDHLARFIECCKATIESSTLLDEELSEICK
jgi:DNA repair exonuclease SbcCD nuclease subunit